MKKISILIFGILIVDIFFLYHHFSTIHQEEYEVLNIDSNFVQDLYSMVNPSNDATVLKGLYQDSKLQNQYIIAIGISKYLKEHSLENLQYIKALEVERMIHSVLGYDITFTHETVFLLQNGICGYQYYSDLHQYEILDSCEMNSKETFDRKIVQAKKSGNKVLITEKLIYLYDDWNDVYSRKYIYNNFKREKVLDYIEMPPYRSYSISFDSYFDDASTYVYSFQLKNETYIFEGITEIFS